MKNIFLLAVGSLLAFHLNLANASENSADPVSSDETSSVLVVMTEA